MIDEKLLKILACPSCKSSVSYDNEKIVCSGCKRKYPIRDCIPIMLIEESENEQKTK